MQAPKLSHDTLVAFCSVPSPIVRFEQYIAASCVTAENVPLPMIVNSQIGMIVILLSGA